MMWEEGLVSSFLLIEKSLPQHTLASLSGSIDFCIPGLRKAATFSYILTWQEENKRDLSLSLFLFYGLSSVMLGSHL